SWGEQNGNRPGGTGAPGSPDARKSSPGGITFAQADPLVRKRCLRDIGPRFKHASGRRGAIPAAASARKDSSPMSQAVTQLQPDERRTTVLEAPPATSSSAGHFAVRTYGLTDPGQVRPSNEDQFLVATLTKALQVQHTSLPQSRVQYGDERSYLFVV